MKKENTEVRFTIVLLIIIFRDSLSLDSFAVQQTGAAAEETGQLRAAASRHRDAANPDVREVRPNT